MVAQRTRETKMGDRALCEIGSDTGLSKDIETTPWHDSRSKAGFRHFELVSPAHCLVQEI